MNKVTVYHSDSNSIHAIYDGESELIWTAAAEPLKITDRVDVCAFSGLAYKHPSGPYELLHLKTEGGKIDKNARFFAKLIDPSATP